jgi:mannose-6-phosphate isomerase-like protein (cupin superfamily)
MSSTYIKTNECVRTALEDGQGEVADIINREICGAEDFTGMLRWLRAGQRFDAALLEDTHQLIYLIEGDGVIELEGESYPVKRGAGIYLGPAETAGINHTGELPLKLLHLIIPIKA